MAQGCRLVRYDRGGCGLSGPSTRRPSMAQLAQLAAVVAAVGPEPFDLVGTSLGALVAVAWAAEHPETVRRLVLYGGWASGAEISPPDVRDHGAGVGRVALGARRRRADGHLCTGCPCLDTRRVRPVPASLLVCSHGSGAAVAGLRTRRHRPAPEGARSDTGGPPTGRGIAPHPSCKPKPLPPESPARNSWCCPAARTCRTWATRTSL